MIVTLRCENCKTEFNPKRMTARFCSTKCRVYSKRKAPIVSKKSVTTNTTTKKVIELIKPKADKVYSFCQHNAVKGMCKKGCK